MSGSVVTASRAVDYPLIALIGFGPLHLVTSDSAANAKMYDEWDTYDTDLRAWGYQAPEQATSLLRDAPCFAGTKDVVGIPGASRGPRAVLDVGCGTGLQAVSLRAEGFHPLVGIDVSRGHLAKATSSSLYDDTTLGDLHVRLPYDDASFAACTCIGVITHVDPSNEPNVLEEMARVTARGGLIVFSFRDDQPAWVQKAHEMAARGTWRPHSARHSLPYLPGHPDYDDKILVSLLCYERT